MRIDKFLKVARVIKRRTIANEAADGRRVVVNGKIEKPSYKVNKNDIITIEIEEPQESKIVAEEIPINII